ncbi:MAG: hypothetical protein NTY45_10250 [Elusimicrobia bacterium]|nr:hypothetical protein [Elusimicrobiota bacterium]
MNIKMKISVWLALSLFASVCSAQEAGLQALSLAYSAASGETKVPRAVNAAELVGFDNSRKPDGDTLASLSRRIPGLDTQNLYVVNFTDADIWMRNAVNAKDTYLDVFTAPSLRPGSVDIYYFSKEVLARLEKKYALGALPVSGVTKDGKPFRLEAIVAGEGRVYFLYDLAGNFSFMDGKDEARVSNSGTVAYQIQGDGDVSIEGLSGCGCLAFFCGCADVQRMTKVSGSRMRVGTSRGPQTEVLTPVRVN